MKTKAVSFCVALLFSGAVCASSKPTFSDELLLFFDEEDLIISATGYDTPAHLAPSVVTVISAEEIAQMGATTVFEALESVPGLHIFPREDGLVPGISIRGIQTTTTPEALLLRNGRPVKDIPSQGNISSHRMTVANISRIEVIRGPGSAVHGADAFSGVINIVTKSTEEMDGTTLGGRVGSFDSQEVWALHGDQYGTWNVAFSLEASHSDGDRDRRIDSDLQTLLDLPPPDGFGTSASQAPGPLETRYKYLDTSLNISNENWNIDLWHWQGRDRAIGPGVAQALDSVGHDDHDYYQVDISHSHRVYSNWEITSRVGYIHQDMRRTFTVFPPGSTVLIGADGNVFSALEPGRGGVVTFPDGALGNPDVQEDKYSIELSALYDGMQDHLWRTNLGFSRQEVETSETKNFGPGVIDSAALSLTEPNPPIDGTLTDVTGTEYIYMADQDREHWFASIQDEWHFAREWALTAGIRYDHFNDFGSTTNPRIALVWTPQENLTTKLLYGRAFRAPALAELYYKNNPAFVGNTNVEPETIDTLELAAEYYPMKELVSRINIYYYDMDDSIDWLPVETEVMATNTDGQRGYGFELDVEWKATDDLKLRSNFAWQHSEMKSGGHRVPDAPGRQFHLSANWQFMPLWNLNTQLNWIGERKRSIGDPRDDAEDYTLVDLTLRRTQVNQNWGVAVAAKNLFDEESAEPSSITTPDDYPIQGRSFFVELSYKH